ncbi:hypothetical protein PQ478_08965 [Alkalihalophilus pseudofirmus]|uniref:hypothetical protein n=1 Tax=Alkalihalophilus pseudofirmus TaxID=79885 RepID=UPI00259BC4B6|nr:hypothetical protein [Alkalihalophilus pseudofirmus]WEG18601.1 hypothetical protein PQ478_08965 [Alkalihalophilus pseudofirmus]
MNTILKKIRDRWNRIKLHDTVSVHTLDGKHIATGEIVEYGQKTVTLRQHISFDVRKIKLEKAD